MSRRHPEAGPSEPPGRLGGEWHQEPARDGPRGLETGPVGTSPSPGGLRRVPSAMSASEHRPRQRRVPNANGENAVSGKCSLINNIKSSSLSAGDIRIPLRSAPAETCNDVLLLAGCEVHANLRHGQDSHTQITQIQCPFSEVSAALCFLSQRGNPSRASAWSLEDFINGVK